MSCIYCSTKLANLIGTDHLSTQSNEFENRNRFMEWNAHLFTINRTKCILVTNKETLYSFIRLNILKKDLADQKGFFITSLTSQLHADKIDNNDKLNNWIGNASDIIFRRTDNDKKVIGSMNDFIFQIRVSLESRLQRREESTDIKVGSLVNSTLMSLIKYDQPLNRLKKTLISL